MPLRRQDLLDMIESARMGHADADIVRFARNVTVNAVHHDVPYGELEFVISDGRVRQTNSFSIVGESERRTATRYRDKDLDVVVQKGPTRTQATLSQSNNVRPEIRFDELICLPELTDDNWLVENERLDEITVSLATGKYRLVIEMRRHPAMVSGQSLFNSSGELIQEVRQLGGLDAPVEFFPRCSYRAVYRNGQLNSLELFWIDSLELANEPYPESEFKASAEPGTIVVDKTLDANQPHVAKIKKHVPDLVEIAATSQSARPDSSASVQQSDNAISPAGDERPSSSISEKDTEPPARREQWSERLVMIAIVSGVFAVLMSGWWQIKRRRRRS